MELAETGLDRNDRWSKTIPGLAETVLLSDSFWKKILSVLDIRYIAIMDNIDTAKGISDLVPMQDLFNEWHAKNTSDKVRKVMQSKGMSGKPLTTNPPFGYMKRPGEQGTNGSWMKPAAKVVRKIFDLCVSTDLSRRRSPNA